MQGALSCSVGAEPYRCMGFWQARRVRPRLSRTGARAAAGWAQSGSAGAGLYGCKGFCQAEA